MIVTLLNGETFNPKTILSDKQSLHGIERETLSFVFNADSTDISLINNSFTSENCGTIIIYDEESDKRFYWNDYVIRVVLIQEGGELKVVMAKLTYEEQEIHRITETQEMHDMILAELLLGEVE